MNAMTETFAHLDDGQLFVWQNDLYVKVNNGTPNPETGNLDGVGTARQIARLNADGSVWHWLDAAQHHNFNIYADVQPMAIIPVMISELVTTVS